MRFDLHGRVGIEVDPDAPGADQLADMFASVLTEHPVRGDLRVTGEHPVLDSPSSVEDELLYTDHTVIDRRQDVGVTRTPDGFVVSGRGELLTTVVPLIDHLMTSRGAAMIHAATLDVDGIGVALPAGGGTGKTSSVAKLWRQPGVAFMGDDWAFLDRSGLLLGFQKPMFIKAHHREVYPELFQGVRKPLVPKAVARPIGRLTTQVHPHVVRYPRIAAAARRWSPEHRMVHFRAAFPDAPVALTAPLGLAVYVERYAGPTPRLEPRPTSWMVDRVLGNYHFELADPSRAMLDALSATGLLPLDRYLGAKRAILEEGLDGVPAYLLRIPVTASAGRASDQVVEGVLGLARSIPRPGDPP